MGSGAFSQLDREMASNVRKRYKKPSIGRSMRSALALLTTLTVVDASDPSNPIFESANYRKPALVVPNGAKFLITVCPICMHIYVTPQGSGRGTQT